tara:strand:- start:163 stop:879 length:717 start_codon:yes stop_codon:yes gene_type:complete
MDETLFKSDINNFNKCLDTLLDKDDGLLKKRNYNIDDYDNNFDNDDLTEFCNESKYEMIFQSKENPKKFIYILFSNTVNILSKNFKALDIKSRFNNFEDFIKEKLNIDIDPNDNEIEINIMLVVTNLIKINLLIISKKLLDKLKLMTNFNLKIEIFLYTELLFNITKHILIPKNIYILKNYEKEQLTKIYNLKNLKQLPYIKKTDPLSKFYGLDYDDILRIIRVSTNSGSYISYRVCV